MLKWLPAREHKAFYPDFDLNTMYQTNSKTKDAPTVWVNKGEADQVVFKRESIRIGELSLIHI